MTAMHKPQKSPATAIVMSRDSEVSSSQTSATLDASSIVHRVTVKDYKAAAACLANAFSEDEVAAYFLNCPDTMEWSEQRKWKLHEQIMDAITYAHLKFGLVEAIGDLNKNDTYDAVTLWMPPGTNLDDYFAMLKKGVMWKAMKTYRKLSKEGRSRMFKEFFPLLGTTKEAVLKERDPDSWYLVYLGTHARARGRGLAKKLVSHIADQADIEGRACYLESSNTVNVPIYRKMGFEVCKQITLHRGVEVISLDIMVREPRSSEKISVMPVDKTPLIASETGVVAA